MDNIEKIIEIIKEELGSELDPDITVKRSYYQRHR